MRSPTISVVMPVFNGEVYLAEAIKSILHQSFQDFEFIIVDDGSTDGTLEILKTFQKSDDRIKVISRPNTGIVGALNDGLARARGEYIARMDADDVSLPDRFERQIDYMSSHPNCVLLGTGHVIMDAEGNDLCIQRTELQHDRIVDRQMRGIGGAILHPTTFMRRNAVEQVGGYRLKYQWVEDLDLFLRLADLGEVRNLAEPLLRYRRHPSTVCSQRRVEQFRLIKLIVSEAFERQGKRLPHDWKWEGGCWSRKEKYQYIAKEAIRNGQKVRAVLFSLGVMCMSPFSRPSRRLLVRAIRATA